MTATPKIASDSVDGELVADMSNEKIYGPEFHRMSFGEAIERGILSDYHVIAVGVTEDELRTKADKNSDEYQDLLNNIALEKVMKKHGATHALSFHSKVAKAEAFSEAHKKLYPKTLSLHVNGTQNTTERENTLARFAQVKAPNKALVTNAKCLTEGVDVPAIDLVYFCDPKSSTVDIVQAAGRAFRKDKNKPSKVGYVVVPILHKPGEEIADVVSKSSFKNVVRVLQALGSADERLVAKLCLNKGERRGGGGGEGGPGISLEGIEEKDLSEKIFSEFIERSGNRLKPLLYPDFDVAVEAIKEACPKRPNRISMFFNSLNEYKEKGMKEQVGLGFAALKTLGRNAGKATDETTYVQLADLIWGEGVKVAKTFASAVEAIKISCPDRPSNLSTYLESQGEYKGKGMKEQIGIKFNALKNLAVDAGKATEDITFAQLADLIWGEGVIAPKTFASAVKAIKKSCPRRPINTGLYFGSQGKYKGKGMKEQVGLGFTALKTLVINAGKATDETTATQLADLIWGEGVIAPKTFASAVEAIKKSCPDRPISAYAYFDDQGDHKGKGMKFHVGIGFKALQNLAVDADEATEDITKAQLADLIWGSKK
jgi:hypothetical protein